MDSITQGALGATIAAAGFEHRLGRKSLIFGAVVGTLPDLDIVARVGGEWAMLVHHRGVTHGFLFAVLATPLVGWLGSRWLGGKRNFGHWVHLAAWILITHPLLDAWTSYGTPLLAPFYWRRFALDGIFIIDFFYTAVLAFAVVLAARQKIPQRIWRGVAIGALGVSSAYLLAGLGMSLRARSVAAEQLERIAFQPVKVRAIPTLSNIFLWRVVARDQDGRVRAGTVSALFPQEIHFISHELPDDPLVRRALESEHGETFSWFADGFVGADVQRREDGASVFLKDFRYGLASTQGWTPFQARAEFDAEDNLKSLRTMHQDVDIGVGRELAVMWHLMWGGELKPASTRPDSVPGAD